jgi:hypothetical protein
MTAEIRDRKMSSNDSETDQPDHQSATSAGQQSLQSEQPEVKTRGSIVLVILSREPADWFVNIIAVMGDVIDAILSDRTLGGTVFDCHNKLHHGRNQVQRILISGGEISSHGGRLGSQTQTKRLHWPR